MSLDLLALGAAPAMFLLAWFGAIGLMRSHQPVVGHRYRRAAVWSVAGVLSIFWMIAILVVGGALLPSVPIG